MGKRIDYIKGNVETVLVLGALIAMTGGAFMGFHSVMAGIDNMNGDIRKAKALALKSIIWNSEIPRMERAAACDTYLDMGLNSYTQRFCSMLMLTIDNTN